MRVRMPKLNNKFLPFTFPILILTGVGLFFTGLLASSFITFGLAKPLTPVGSIQPKSNTEVSREVSILSRELIRVSKLTQASVVNITATGRFEDAFPAELPPNNGPPYGGSPYSRRFFGPDQSPPYQPLPDQQQGTASGVIISPDGFILTNNHVVEGASDIRILLTDHRRFPAKVVGNDPKTDLAVLKIQGSGLPNLQWGDSTILEVGEIVVAVGNPFGLNQTVTMGIISAVGRANVGIVDFEDFIQTDAAINPGNSGGALVNLRGELIGINTAIFSQNGGSMGIGFAIPSEMAKAVSKILIEKGKVVRGWMGTSIQELTTELAKQFKAQDTNGVLIGDVVEGGPADQAKIQRVDIIRKFNGKTVTNPRQLQSMVASTKPGTSVKITILREGRDQETAVIISEHPRHPISPDYSNQVQGNHALDGITVQPLIPGQGRESEGILVSSMAPGSTAEQSGLQIADIIIEVNRKPVRIMKDFTLLTSQLKPQDGVLLLVRRGTATIFIPVQRNG